jgi:5-methylcytosine-specific restriction enzyme subunit McrC
VIIRLREFGPEQDVELAGSVAARLASSGLVEVLPAGNDRWTLRPVDRVGAVRIGELDVVVEPKVGPEGLLFLLGYAADPGFRPEDVEGVEREDLLPVLAESLARQVERATGQGVLQGYVTLDEALPVVRGRLRAADQMGRRPGTLLPIEVTYDDYSADIPENRIVRSAVRRIMAVSRVRPEIRRRLGHLDGRLDGVTPLIPGEPMPEWQASRLNQRYVPALRLAEIVLRHLSAEVGEAGVPVASFVVDMAKVFEDFVTTALQEATAGYPGRTEGQYPVNLAIGGGVPMRPDVVHLAGGHAQAVFDAKYKIESERRGVPNTDVYQMLAYCTALRLDHGYLVYAKGHGEAVAHRIVNTDPAIEIIQHPLDLADSPTGLLAQIDRLAVDALDPIRVSAAAA